MIKLISKLIKILASGFGLGYFPLAPGTFGTVLGVGLFWLMRNLPASLYIAAVVVFIFLAIGIASQAAKIYGQSDPSRVVIDEVVGFLVTMIAQPISWPWIVAGFVIFRFFDIVKPFPIRLIERRLKGGFGIVLDDVLAGVYSGICLGIGQYVIQ